MVTIIRDIITMCYMNLLFTYVTYLLSVWACSNTNQLLLCCLVSNAKLLNRQNESS